MNWYWVRLRSNHLFTFEAFMHVLVFAIAVAALAIALQATHTKVPVLSPEPQNVVPATGAQGYPIEAFACADYKAPDRLTVKLSIPPPEATFAATYDLDRRLGGVHETITVSVYPDGSTVAIYHDSNNVPRDGNVTADALKCIREKAK